MDTLTLEAASNHALTAQPARFDLYTTIHKALRQFMADTLLRVGRMDASDADDTRETLEQLQALLGMLRSHLAHENTFIHAAIEARRPGAVDRVADDHEEHLATIDELEARAQALRDAAGADRRDSALRLYRHLALFIAENLEHMHVEETSNHALLWALFGDTELIALHERLLASVPMDEMAVVLRWMAGALNLDELAGMLGAMKTGMPPPAFEGVLELMRPQISNKRWTRLAERLHASEVAAIA
jgi:hemerythrin-like domain-containing protein